MTLPIALQLYSVREACREDFPGTLRALKEMGYAGVEFAGLHGRTPAEVKALLKEVGLIPVSAHVAFAEMMKDPEGVFSAYREIGCPYIAVPSLPGDRRPGGENFEATLADLAMLGKKAAQYGLTLLYHNHDFEFIRLSGRYGLDVMYETVPADALQTELDTCWVKVGGEDPAAYVRKYTGRAPVVHLKDYFGEKSENMYELIGEENKAPARPANFQFRPIGHGLQDVPSILDASLDAGAKWIVVEQDSPSMEKSEMECAQMSREYLKSLDW